MQLPQASWCVLTLWATLGVLRADASCTTTHQSHNNKEVRCHFTPGSMPRSRRPGAAPPTTVVLQKVVIASAPTDVTKMDISNSEVADVRLATFTGYRSLRHLDLSYNKLTRLKVGSFEGLTELTHLNVSNNFIMHLGLSTFSANPKLQILDLNMNKLSVFEWGVFEKMGSLQHLYLAKNTLQARRLGENVLGSLTGMVYLDFSANDMNAAPNTMLEAMPNLEVLILRKCSLMSIPDYILKENMKNMKHLVLSKNEISTVNKNAFSLMVNLEILDLSENGLDNLNSEIFYALRNLKQLHLNGNKLVNIPYGIFARSTMLEQIDLSRNDIKCLSIDAFESTSRLKVMNLEYNSLIDIGSAVDGAMKGLQSLFINHNPWNCYSLRRLVKMMNINKVYYGRHNFDGKSVACKRTRRQYDFCMG